LVDEWTGCESYVFLTDEKQVSALDSNSLWESLDDLSELVSTSPENVHYFFVASRSEITASDDVVAMQSRVNSVLAALDEDDESWWSDRLHVVAEHRNEINGWVEEVLDGNGGDGFVIDRLQQIYLLGNFADVSRYDAALANAEQWPWEGNLAYAAHEARASNHRSDRAESQAAESNVTTVSPWAGEVLQGTVETDVVLPDATTMAGFDTFEIDLTMDCPEPEQGESGNCGAWDYLTQLYLLAAGESGDDDDDWIEIARFITTYHREGRYLVDATGMLALMKDGGTQRLRFVLSPSWNQQAYRCQMDFRFSNRGKGYAPTEAHWLWGGASFNSNYNDRASVQVPVPATATRVELWAIISGHGMDAGNCAEFCDHHHEFTVNGATFTQEHPEAADQEGCVDQIENGMTPNQGGTWWYGRGGWCPGQQVDPFVMDVTSSVSAGGLATVSYQGLLNGSTPPDNSGNIQLSSHLVVFE